MLAGDEQTFDLDRALRAVLVDLVANRHLRLAVRAQVRHQARLAHLGHALADLVREQDRQRHQLGGLVRGVSEHHPLVARALTVKRVFVAVLCLVGLVHPARDVGRLLVDRGDHAAGLGVEAELGARVADLRDLRPHQFGDVDVGVGRDLAGDDHEPGSYHRLASDPSHGIAGEHGIEHRVGDRVGDLVRMALGD